jgi:hypothetical protein
MEDIEVLVAALRSLSKRAEGVLVDVPIGSEVDLGIVGGSYDLGRLLYFLGDMLEE